MAQYAFERLSAQDASFLFAERENQPMHVGALAMLESGPLRREDGGIDIERFRRAVEAVLHWIPRYRQKLEWTPIEGWPVWVDDRHFDIGYHIRHIALPKPGGPEQLREIAARIHARPLDRRSPMWEMWVLEGVAGGEQFALLNKIHHCMIDGAAGADLSQILMSNSSRSEIGDPVPYMPRPAPSRAELLADSVRRSVGRPLQLARSLAETVAEREAEAPGLERRWRAFQEMAGFALEPAPATPLNGELSPYRRIDWLTMPLDDIRELRSVLECTINDVVLTTVCGAMRRYLFRRRVELRDLELRVAAPVSTRRDDHDRRQGNHVSSWVVRLPLGESDPLAQVAAIRAQTEQLKRSEAALAVDTLMELAEWLPAPFLSFGAELAGAPANMIVTNVPGPQFPLYMVGARLLGMYPLVPLLPRGGLGVALFSYEGKLCWGFNADDEIVPDLGTVVDDVRASFEELRSAVVSHYMASRTAAPEAAPERGKKAGKKKRSRRKKDSPGRRNAASEPGNERLAVVAAPAEPQ